MNSPLCDFELACELAADFANQNGGDLQLAEDCIIRLGWPMPFGTEYVSLAGRELAYLNTGDTYSVTVGAEDGKVFVTTWGDWHEGVEQEHCEEDGVIRCGYCGEFTPMDEEDWRDVVCEHCGNNVGG